MTRMLSRKFVATVSAGTIALIAFSWTAQAQDAGVVARVGDVEITEADMVTAAAMYGDQLDNMPDDAKRSVTVDALIDIELARAAAKKAGLDQSDAFRRQMAFLEGQALRAAFMDAEFAKRVDDAAVQKAYDAYIAEQKPVEEFRASHILLGSEADAVAAIDRLKAGEDFATVAAELSLDQASKQKGGDLGFVTRGSSLPEIETAVSNLKSGAFTEQPVQSSFGYHVIRLEEVRSRPAPTLEALKPQLRQALEGQAAQQVAAELRAATKVEKLVPDVQPSQADDGHNQEEGAP